MAAHDVPFAFQTSLALPDEYERSMGMKDRIRMFTLGEWGCPLAPGAISDVAETVKDIAEGLLREHDTLGVNRRKRHHYRYIRNVSQRRCFLDLFILKVFGATEALGQKLWRNPAPRTQNFGGTLGRRNKTFEEPAASHAEFWRSPRPPSRNFGGARGLRSETLEHAPLSDPN